MPKRLPFWLAISILSSVGCISCAKTTGHERIDGTRAHALVQSGAKLVDVRTASEFGEKHLPNAINIPVQQLSERQKELEPKDQALILYCRSGHRSGVAYDQLKGAGFTQLYDLGPISAW